jgi:hypothetical protein
MTDRREQVLTAILAALKEVSGVQSVIRNRGALLADMRPAVVLLDGDENSRDPPPQGRGQLSLSPNLIDLTPEIYVVMDTRLPQNEGIGEDMNALRVLILTALMSNAALIAVLGSNGDIKYDGCETDMASGRSMEGQMHLRLTFTYVLRPSEL